MLLSQLLLAQQLDLGDGLAIAFYVVLSAIAISCVVAWSLFIRRGKNLADSTTAAVSAIGFIDLSIGFVFWIGSQMLAGMVFVAIKGPGAEIDFASVDDLIQLMLYSSGSQLLVTLALVALFQFRYQTPAAKRVPGFDWTSSIWSGMIGFILIVPIILMIQWLLSLIVPYEHPTLKAMTEQASTFTIGVCWFAAVFVAPITEEYFFRGMLQNWLQRINPQSVTTNEILFGGYSEPVSDESATQTQLPKLLNEDGVNNPYRAPSFNKTIETVPNGDSTGRNAQPPIWPIFVTSLLFALAHIGQGLAPVALFFFSVGLGLLYRRTNSLIPCIVTHMLLNGYSMFWFTLSIAFGEAN
ncbi:MAG: CPBP family intramembrane glutamic endopeptidase [Planctomycetota bacterium]